MCVKMFNKFMLTVLIVVLINDCLTQEDDHDHVYPTIDQNSFVQFEANEDYERKVEYQTKKLKEFFNTTQYRLNINNNSSAVCPFTNPRQRLQRCHQVHVFDWAAYNKTLTDLRSLFIMRLGITKFPFQKNTIASQKRIRLLSEIDKHFNQQQNKQQYGGATAAAANRMVKHTSFDKEDMKKRTVQSIYMTKDVSSCDAILNKPVQNALCLSFATTVENFFHVKSNTLQRTFASVYLLINVNIKKYNRLVNTTQIVRITEIKSQRDIYTNVQNGWNSIDISNLIKPGVHLNESLLETLMIRCPSKECLLSESAHEEAANFTKLPKMPIVYLNSSPKLRALLQINNFDEKSYLSKHRAARVKKQVVYAAAGGGGGGGGGSSGDFDGENNDDDDDDSMPTNICRHNRADPRSKCCLVSFTVDFYTLRLTPWIYAPLSYNANYCFGQCKFAKANQNSSYHLEIKNRFNEYSRRMNDTEYLLPTCCHPTRMSSLKVKYKNSKDQIMTKVLPNMIVTECGCS